MHGKGGGVYDESINVPLYISFPNATYTGRQARRIPRSFVCSSVDLLPFMYSMVLGNNSWRTNSSDIIYYLNNREALNDAVFASSPVQHRTATGIPNANGSGNQPYILHTCDEDDFASIPEGTYCTIPNNNTQLQETLQPSHVIGFRTVDLTVHPNGAGTYGGGKLGIYSFWPTNELPPSGCPTNSGTCCIWPSQNNQLQFELYNYNSSSQYPTGNYAELGNDAFSSGSWTSMAETYRQSFNSIQCGELYDTNFPGQSPAQLYAAFQLAYQRYLAYVHNTCANCQTPPAQGACPPDIPQP